MIDDHKHLWHITIREIFKQTLSMTKLFVWPKIIWQAIYSTSRKNPNRGGQEYTFLKNSWEVLDLPFYPLEIPDKMKLHPCWKFHKIVLLYCNTHWNFQGGNTKAKANHQSRIQDPWKFHDFFLITLRKSNSFYILFLFQYYPLNLKVNP